MTLKEELEILRGEPIQVFTGDPKDIPCIETSDSEKLCKKPVVSVHMITYNHEPYIRQAIEGIMMQKADFEFELVIGEDASTDKTREICLEYQKKHPDKIRVLWWHENVSRLGGNSRRNFAHCRGEFVAFCEGDDYWTDANKLQRQINLLYAHPEYSGVADGGEILFVSNNTHRLFNSDSARAYTISEMIDKRRFPTAGVVLRAKWIPEFLSKTLVLLDTITWCFWATKGVVYYTAANSSVYRRGNQGITGYTPKVKWAELCEKWCKEMWRLYHEYLTMDFIIDCMFREFFEPSIACVRMGRFRESWYLFKKAYRCRPFRTCSQFFIIRPFVSFVLILSQVLRHLGRKVFTRYASH